MLIDGQQVSKGHDERIWEDLLHVRSPLGLERNPRPVFDPWTRDDSSRRDRDPAAQRHRVDCDVTIVRDIDRVNEGKRGVEVRWFDLAGPAKHRGMVTGQPELGRRGVNWSALEALPDSAVNRP